MTLSRLSRFAFVLVLLGFVGAVFCVFRAQPARAETPGPDTIDFNRDVRAIFSDNCYACHGPDANKRKANLRLDIKDGLFTAIKGRKPVVPGKPEQSELYKRITNPDPDERMPEKSFNKSLTDRQIAIVRKWIEQGAQWKGHGVRQ